MILPQLTLSWPARALWINQRSHWAVKNRAQQALKREAWVLALSAGWNHAPIGTASVLIDLTFCAPTRTSRYDLDGALTAMKGALDGLAEALGVDDKLFVPVLRRGDKSKSGGVIVRAEVLNAVQQAVARGDSDKLRPVRGRSVI